MKLEYIELENEPSIVRLYRFNKVEVKLFIKTIKVLIKNSKPIELHKEKYINSINCELILMVDNENMGIVKMNGNKFFCKLNLESYHQMIERVKRFIPLEDGGHFQWLYDLMCSIEFLFSEDGGW